MIVEFVPAELRCEYLADPLGIDIACPRLSWVLQSAQRGQRQTAYQVLVASSEHILQRGEGDLWDTGKVISSDSAHIAYNGLELRSGQRCWWQVRVWDRHGVRSAYSPAAWWEMGLLEASDWRGTWISYDTKRKEAGLPAELETHDDASGLIPSPYLRTTFSTAQPIRRARLCITARGLYEARLNGQRLGNAVLAPGWTDYAVRIQYQVYDVGHLLRHGKNALGVILGTGWYSGCVGFDGRANHYGSRPQLLAQLHIEHDDGTAQIVATDGSWRATTGPILFSDLLMGETFDARLARPAWDTATYDDSAWMPVELAERDTTRLVACRSEPVQITEELAPRAIARLDADTHIVDMGQNIVGWVRLRMRGMAGTRVRVRFGEVLAADATLYTDNLRSARATDTYILAGTGEEIFEPRFTFHGFRYVEVAGYPGDLSADAVRGCVVGSAVPQAGTFECSDPMVNQLQRNIVWSQRGNFLSIPTDCPQRDERLGWLGDAQVFARTACCNQGVAPFFTNWLADVASGQSPDGAFADIAPLLRIDLGQDVSVGSGTPAWGDAGVIVPWTLYQCYGDTRIIAEHYESMARWIAYIQGANADNLWINRRGNDFGDWLALDGATPSELFKSATPRELLASAYYAHDVYLMARMARAIGRLDEAIEYEALFRASRAAFIKAFVDPDGRLLVETQTGYLLALGFDLLPSDLRTRAAARLVDLIKEKDNHLSTGFIGIGYLLPVLTEAGYLDLAYRILLNRTYPSWGYSISHGATTIWERWDGWTADAGFQAATMNSFNHYSLGSVGEWLFRYVAGIDVDPDHPGYQHVIIRPHPGGGLTYARAEYRSIHGTIVSMWRLAGNELTLHVTIPPNTTATVHLPVNDVSAVTDGATPIARSADVEMLPQTSERVVISPLQVKLIAKCAEVQAAAGSSSAKEGMTTSSHSFKAATTTC